MKNWLPGLFYFGLIILTHFSHADNSSWQVFGGPSYIDYPQGSKNQSFTYNEMEVDQLSPHQTQNPHTGFTVGIKHGFFESDHLIHKLQIGAALRYDPVTFKGEVYRDKTYFWNDYSYRYSVTPISEQLLLVCVFAPFKTLSPYVSLDLGATEANLSYVETAQPWIDPATAHRGSSSALMIDAGFSVGLEWPLTNHWTMSAEYLYQYRGHSRTEVFGFATGVPINLNENSVNLQLNYLI